MKKKVIKLVSMLLSEFTTVKLNVMFHIASKECFWTNNFLLKSTLNKILIKSSSSTQKLSIHIILAIMTTQMVWITSKSVQEEQ